MSSKDDQKTQKKLAKAEAKAAKKDVSAPGGEPQALTVSEGSSAAERSAEAAEKQLQLHKWKVIFAALSALIALGSLIVLLLR